MSYIPFIVSLGLLAQAPTPKADSAPDGKTGPAAKAEAKAAPGKSDSKAEPGKQAAPPPEPESEIDKFLRAMADKADGIVSLAAEITQKHRYHDKDIVTNGNFKLGENKRVRFEISIDAGGAIGKRLYISNGVTAYRLDEMGTDRRLYVYKVDQIWPLLDAKQIKPEERRAFIDILQLPFFHPGDMLRGFLTTVTFTEKKEEKLGDRHVVKLEGRWRRSLLSQMIPQKAEPTVEDLGNDVPQYLWLTLDKETGFPLVVEHFRRDKIGLYKPVLSIRFTKLTINKKIPDDEFVYVPPTKVIAADQTPFLVQRLRDIVDRRAKEPAPAAKETPKTPATNGKGS